MYTMPLPSPPPNRGCLMRAQSHGLCRLVSMCNVRGAHSPVHMPCWSGIYRYLQLHHTLICVFMWCFCILSFILWYFPMCFICSTILFSKLLRFVVSFVSLYVCVLLCVAFTSSSHHLVLEYDKKGPAHNTLCQRMKVHFCTNITCI